MMTSKKRTLSLLEAFIVTFLWSTSYIFIRIGLEEINPLAFAAYRYFIASLILLFPFFNQLRTKKENLFNPKRVLLLLALGFSGYFIAQGFQFLGLSYLNSLTVTFILNLTPIFVLALSVFFLNERPTRGQMIGIIFTLFGVFIFFNEALIGIGIITGVVITFISGVGWALYMILCRYYFAENNESVISLTAISMLFGAIMLIGVTGFSGNLVNVSFNGWIIILWLGIVNTAVAFFLWNHALKTLKVIEQSILQNSMLIQIAILAFIFLQEPISVQQIIGMIIVFSGVLIVQLRGSEIEQKISKLD